MFYHSREPITFKLNSTSLRRGNSGIMTVRVEGPRFNFRAGQMEQNFANGSSESPPLRRLLSRAGASIRWTRQPPRALLFRAWFRGIKMPLSVASAERSFSKLKLIKTFVRSTKVQERLDSYATISIERDYASTLDMAELVKSFAKKKARKMIFWCSMLFTSLNWITVVHRYL